MLSGCFSNPSDTYYYVSASGENREVYGKGYARNNGRATLYAQPNKGYRFDRWSDGNTYQERQINVTSHVNLIAYFVPVVSFVKAEVSIIPYGSADGYYLLQEFSLKYNGKYIAGDSSAINSRANGYKWRPFYATGDYVFDKGEEASFELDFFVKQMDNSVNTIDYASPNNETLTFEVNSLYPLSGSISNKYYQIIINSHKTDNFKVDIRLFFE